VRRGHELVEDNCDELTLETIPLSLLFFLKKGFDDQVLESLVQCVEYIQERQDQLATRVVDVIYLEPWALPHVPASLKTPLSPYSGGGTRQQTKFVPWYHSPGDSSSFGRAAASSGSNCPGSS
jgi:hypothetical protein